MLNLDDKKKKTVKEFVEKSFEFLIGDNGTILLKSSNEIGLIRQAIFNLEILRDEFNELYPNYKQKPVELESTLTNKISESEYDKSCDNKKRFLFEYKYRIMNKIDKILDKDLSDMKTVNLFSQFTEKIEKLTNFDSE